MTGRGKGRHTVVDSSGSGDVVAVSGSSFDEQYLLVVGKVSALDEFVEYSGIERLTLNAGAGYDTFDMRSTSAATPVHLDGGADSDLFRVSSDAGNGANGDLLGINGPLTIDAGGGLANRIVVSAFGAAPAGPVVLRADGSTGFHLIEGMASGVIRYAATGGGFLDFQEQAAIAGYDRQHGIILRGSNSGGDVFYVRDVFEAAVTRIEGNGGNDLVRVSSDAGSAADDSGHLDGILGDLVIDAGAGDANRLVITDLAGAGNDAVQEYDPDHPGYLLLGALAPGTISYIATGGAFTNGAANDGVLVIGSEAGDDTFSVRATLAGSTTKIEGRGGNDSFVIGSLANSLDEIAGKLSLAGGAHTALPTTTFTAGAITNENATGDRVSFNDHGDGSSGMTYTLAADSLARTGLAQPISFGTVETVTLNAGIKAASVDITGTPVDSNVYVHTQDEADTVTVHATAAGTNLRVDTRSESDQVNVRATGTGGVNLVFTGAGDDVVRVSSNAGLNDDGDLDAIAGYLTVDAGRGGGNRLIVSDFGGAPNADVTVTDARITGFAPATIDYLATGGSFTNGAANDGILLRGSNSAAGGDNFLILSTLGGSTTTIEGHGGADVLNVGSRSVPDNGDLDNIRGLLTLVGGVGDDGIYINDRAKPGRANYTVAPDRVVHFDLPPSMVAPVPLQGVVDPPRPLFAGIRYDGSSERLRLDGSDDVNIFDVKPSVDTTYHLDGNLPPSGVPIFGGGDYLRLDTKGTLGRYLSISAVGVGQWRFTSPHKAVTFSSIERFNHVEKVATVFGNRVVVRDAETNKVVFTVRPYEPYFRGTVSAVMADIDFDGLPDLVVAPGTGRGPTLKVYNGTPNANGAYAARLVTSFDVFAPTMRAGVNLSAGDLNADGAVDVVVSAGPGWLPQVRAYDGLTLRTTRRSLATFNAFAPSVRGGVRPVVADLDNDGRSEIIVGSGPGMSGTVSVFTGAGVLRKTFQPFGPVFRNGVNVAVGDVNRDGVRDLAVTQDAGGLPLVRVYDGRTVYASVPTLLVPPFLAFANNTRTGVTVAAKPTDGGDPGFVEAVSLLMGSGPNGGAVSRKVVQGLWSAGRIAVLDRIFEDASVNGIRLG